MTQRLLLTVTVAYHYGRHGVWIDFWGIARVIVQIPGVAKLLPSSLPKRIANKHNALEMIWSHHTLASSRCLEAYRKHT